MGLRVLEDVDGESVVYCSTTMRALPWVFESAEDAEDFLVWAQANLTMDLRRYSPKEQERFHDEWLAVERASADVSEDA